MIRVGGREWAETAAPGPGEVIISISTPGDDPADLHPGWLAVLRLSFHDLDPERRAHHRGLDAAGYVYFSDADARAVLDFVELHAARPLTVHCDAGISRSVAIGRYVAALQHRPVEYVRRDTGDRLYNQHVWALLVREQRRRDAA